MASIAEFTLSSADFPLGEVFEEYPDVRFELDRVVPTADTVMPYFWVLGQPGDMPGVLADLEDLEELRSVVLMEDLGDEGLFRAEWEPEYLGIMSAIEATGVTVLTASGSADGWVFQLRAGSSETFSEFTAFCDEHGIDVSLTRLSRLSEMTGGVEYGLTGDQREALVLAYEEGYYDEPRATDLETLAGEIGISRPAFSARLRRGYRNFVENALLEAPDDRDST